MKVMKAVETHALMQQKAVRGLSFGYDATKKEYDGDIRILNEVKLYEIAPVVFPMQTLAQITAVKEKELENAALEFFEAKPYPNEHSARIKNPDLFDSKTFRRKKDGTIYGKIKVPATAAVIWGKTKEHNKPADNPIPQAIRFPTENWTAAQAKKWLADNNVKHEKFEPAAKSIEGTLDFLTELKTGRVISSANMKLIKQAIQALSALLEAAEPPKGTPGQEPHDNDDKPGDHLLSGTVKELQKLFDSKKDKKGESFLSSTIETVSSIESKKEEQHAT
jgi:hypothetical protein